MSDPLISLDKLSEPITKLVEVVASGIGTLYQPFGTVRQAKADAKAKLIIAKADCEVLSLSERANSRLGHRESLRQSNIESIVSMAAKEMPESVSDRPVDIDWTLQFFDTAQDICDDEMQSLWARILAGEVSTPGSYSKRTLQFLKTMDKFEAEKFVDFCSFVFQFRANDCFIVENDCTNKFLIEKAGNYDLFSHFHTLGLITESFIGDNKLDEIQVNYFETKYTFVAKEKPNQRNGRISLFFGYRRLTQLGMQLYQIANATPVDNYPRELSKQLEADCQINLVSTLGGTDT
ncbi:DUF2806 domain-containing protein [Vibrio coralliilyticus]|uniref:DUF2806 domain-containing protein n=1 Tax=Vibrio coralliilyticus TaxID=190893 RepID=A0AAP6ZQ73_9VIBR|nr:DUF2806 domain-containing protein [Vibrio coralliilyticus]NOJ25422.1 DUF2806 domain-containing protein [Vibrio coralliilyticus]